MIFNDVKVRVNCQYTKHHSYLKKRHWKYWKYLHVVVKIPVRQ